LELEMDGTWYHAYRVKAATGDPVLSG